MAQTSPVQILGAIDQGTSSSRFILFNQHGQKLASVQKEIKTFYPQNGWAEQDPLEILSSVTACMSECLDGFFASPSPQHQPKNLVAIGVSNQRETTIVWDKTTGKPLYNAIVWHDGRAHAICERLIAQHGGADAFRAVCGLPINGYFSAMKLMWLMENVPEVKEAIKDNRALFGTVDSWLIWNLTGGVEGGVHVTDVTNASRTMLMNLATCTYDPTLLKAFSIPASVLPAIKSSAEVYGSMKHQKQKQSDSEKQENNEKKEVWEGVAIAGCLGDQQAALVGQLCLQKGTAKNTYGTGCFMLMNTGTTVVQSSHGLLSTVAFKMGPDQPTFYALEGSVSSAGSAIKWLRDELKLVSSAAECSALAGEADDSQAANLYLVPAFAGLLSPYWREDARGVLVGLTLSSNRNDICRAALDAACYSSRDVLEAMVLDSHIPLRELRVDGGMTASDRVCQFQADLLNIPVYRPLMAEATACGAAFAAGLAMGVWKDVSTLHHDITCTSNPASSSFESPSSLATSSSVSMASFASTTEEESKSPRVLFRPTLTQARRDELYNGWKAAVQRSFNWDCQNRSLFPPSSSTSLKPGLKPLSSALLRRNVIGAATLFVTGVVVGVLASRRR